jgi:hypothetical protein
MAAVTWAPHRPAGASGSTTVVDRGAAPALDADLAPAVRDGHPTPTALAAARRELAHAALGTPCKGILLIGS